MERGDADLYAEIVLSVGPFMQLAKTQNLLLGVPR
jgi:hypothetical protein